MASSHLVLLPKVEQATYVSFVLFFQQQIFCLFFEILVDFVVFVPLYLFDDPVPVIF
jgi:hypothetical protein